MTGGYDPTTTPQKSDLIQAQAAVYRRNGIEPVFWPRLAGSWPGYVGARPVRLRLPIENEDKIGRVSGPVWIVLGGRKTRWNLVPTNRYGSVGQGYAESCGQGPAGPSIVRRLGESGVNRLKLGKKSLDSPEA